MKALATLIIAADRRKVGRAGFTGICRLDDRFTVITDSGARPEELDEIRATGAAVEVAEETWKQNLGVTEDKTALEIGQAYLDFLTQQEIKAKQEQVSIQDIQTQLNDINSALADILGGEM